MTSINLQSFFESVYGQILTVGVILIVFFCLLISRKNEPKTTTKVLVLSAVFIALSVVLGAIPIFNMPQGGSVTLFSMVPLSLVTYFYGLRKGVMAGVCVGLLNLLFNPFIIHPLQLLLDYPIAYGAIGLGGIFIHKKRHTLQWVYLFGLICRWICATLSGVIFFSSYLPERFPVLIASAWYNLTYLGIEGILSLIIISVPAFKSLIERLKSNAY